MNKRFGSIAVAGYVAVAVAMSGSARATAAEMEPTSKAETLVLAPLSYLQFCNRNPKDCNATSDTSPADVVVDRGMLSSINKSVNLAIRPVRKASINGIESWEINPRAGDCNDFAVSKRHELLAHGWPSQSLMLATVLTSWGEPHLVLLVRDHMDVLVLDNLHQSVRAFRDTDYTWINRQSSANPNRWVSMVNDPMKLQVASHAQPDAGG